MREIKFRGNLLLDYVPTKYERTWVYGDLVRELETGRTFILDLSHFTEETKLSDVMMEVDPKSVGQFTGLKDKNGKEIYEGDILILKPWGVDKSIEVVKDMVELLQEYGHYSAEYGYKEIEVIGNIYENPELLKTTNENQISNKEKFKNE